MIEKNLYKDRGYTACLSASLDLLCSNFANIFRKTWLVALACSVALGACALLGSTYFVLPLIVASILLACWFGGIVVTMINDKGRNKNFLHVLRMVVLNIGIGFVFAVLLVVALLGLSYITGKGLTSNSTTFMVANALVVFVFGAAFLVLAVPLAYANAKYVVEHGKSVWSIVGTYYKRGWRSWGFLFVVGILLSIILMLTSAIMGFPYIITQLAAHADMKGIMAGDASGLPSYFGWLTFFVHSAVSFVSLYVEVWVLFVACYAYGRIETRQREQQEMEQAH